MDIKLRGSFQGTGKESKSKLKELALYIIDKSKNDKSFNLDKLNWLLYLSDMNAYLLYGKSITGQVYIKES